MLIIYRIVLLIFFVGLPFCSFAKVAVLPQFVMVPEKSTLTFTAFQNDVPVEGKFGSFSVDIIFDPDRLGESSVRADIHLGSVITAYPDIEKQLKMPDWFNVQQFPAAQFVSDYFIHIKDKRYKAEGKLTLRGVTYPVTLYFTLDRYDLTGAAVKGHAVLSRIPFGVGQGEWKSTSVVADEVKVQFSLEAQRK